MYVLVESQDLRHQTFGQVHDFLATHRAFDVVYQNHRASQFQLKRDYFYRSSRNIGYFIMVDATKGSLSPRDEPVKLQFQYYTQYRSTKGNRFEDLIAPGQFIFDLNGFFRKRMKKRPGWKILPNNCAVKPDLKLLMEIILALQFIEMWVFYTPKTITNSIRAGVKSQFGMPPTIEQINIFVI
ncbi:MAG: hypothetical protein Q8O88_01490 [bacterium]|nr:hypothetical protein [bacterium]